jgi:hypothetical protein
VTRRVIAIVGGALLVLALGAACTDTGDLEDQVDTLEQQQAVMATQLETLAQTQKADVLAALTALDAASLHELQEETSAGELSEGATGSVDTALRAMVIVWPEELQSMADDLVVALEELATAVDSGDAATVAGPAANAHDVWHEFDEEATAWLTGEEAEEHEEGEESTPAADETPAAVTPSSEETPE